jgi:hypothetical protein
VVKNVSDLGLNERCVVPLFAEDARGRPSLHRSACAVKIAGDTFLFTAGHVLDPLPKKGFSTFVRGRALPLAGDLISSTRMDRAGKEYESVDLGIIRLTGAVLPEHPISPDQTTPQFAFYESHPVLFVGWPTSRAKPRFQLKKVDAELHRITLPASPVEQYRTMDLIPELHVAARFDSGNLLNGDGVQVSSPALYGMSGGGVFIAGPSRTGISEAKELVGITVGFADAKRSVLFGVRLGIFFALLTSQYPELLAALPATITTDPLLQQSHYS